MDIDISNGGLPANQGRRGCRQQQTTGGGLFYEQLRVLVESRYVALPTLRGRRQMACFASGALPWESLLEGLEPREGGRITILTIPGCSRGCTVFFPAICEFAGWRIPLHFLFRCRSAITQRPSCVQASAFAHEVADFRAQCAERCNEDLPCTHCFSGLAKCPIAVALCYWTVLDGFLARSTKASA